MTKRRFLTVPFIAVALLPWYATLASTPNTSESPVTIERSNAEQPPDDEQNVKVYPLKHMDGDFAMRVLSSILSSSTNTRMNYSPRNNSIVVLGTQKDHAVVTQLLQQLDVPPAKSEAIIPQMVEMNILFVVSGDRFPGALTPSHQVLRVLKELEPHPYIPPFKDPYVAGAMVTRVSLASTSESRENKNTSAEQGSRFSSQSSTAGGTLQLQVSGKINRMPNDNQTFLWDGKLQVEVTPSTSERLRSEIATQVSLPLDHPVVLGFTQIGGMNGLVIIEAKYGDH